MGMLQLTGECMACPRRSLAPHAEELDYWDWTRWRLSWLDRVILYITGRQPHAFWPPQEPHARVCSYCGCLHPEDALVLLSRGWTLHGQEWSRVYFLHPPTGPSPDPPVVIEPAHFTMAQRARLRTLLKRAAVR